MAGSKKLASYVHVEGEDGQMYVFGPDDKVPDWASKKMGDHVWAKGGDDDEDLVAGPSLTLPETRAAAEAAAKAGAKAEADAKAAEEKAKADAAAAKAAGSGS